MRPAILILLFSSVAWADAAVPTTKAAGDRSLKLTHYVVPVERADSFFWPHRRRRLKAPRYFTPSAGDVNRLERTLADGLGGDVMRLRSEHGGYPYGEFWEHPIWEQLDLFDLQYVGVVLGGRRLIWVNAFFRDPYHPDPVDRPHHAEDGGSSEWRIYFDLETGIFFGYEENDRF